ncbi:MAG: S8 family serine peptidase [Algoriphagus sp.]|nr:S8 family serine peptidase [Algoriphagus sp.]
MKKLLILTVLALVAWGCNTKIESTHETALPADDPYSKGILVFLDSKDFTSVLDDDPDAFNEGWTQEQIEKLASPKKEKIKEFSKKNFDLDLKDDEIHVEVDSWFFAGKITPIQLRKIESNIKVIENYPNYEIDVHSRKPMMQGGPVIQSRKPMMQEELRYDSVRFASDLILLAGGGDTLVPRKNETIWIVDSGIDKNHQDLKSSVDTTRGFCNLPGGACDQYVDENGHGTLIAGVIGGKAFNQTTAGNNQYIGINGVYPGAKMVSVRVLDSSGTGTLNTFAAGLDYLLTKVVAGDVVNISLGKPDVNNCNWGPLGQKISRLAIDKNVTVVLSAGNDTSPSLSNFPGCIDNVPNIITVGSINVYCAGTEFFYSSFSNYGKPSIDWVAPGELIFSTYLNNEYGLVSGTSFSAAIVSGIVYGKGGAPDTLGMVSRGADSSQYSIAYWRK